MDSSAAASSTSEKKGGDDNNIVSTSEEKVMSSGTTTEDAVIDLLDTQQPPPQPIYAVQAELVDNDDNTKEESLAAADDVPKPTTASDDAHDITTTAQTATLNYTGIESNDDSVNDDVPTNTHYYYGGLPPKEKEGKTTKLRHRFGRGKKKKQQQQQEQLQKQFLAFQKFESECKTVLQTEAGHDDDYADDDEVRSWGGLLPPYSPMGSDTDTTDNRNNNRNDNRRVRFDMSHTESNNNNNNDNDDESVHLHRARIVKYRNALKIVTLIGMAILLTALAWVTGATGLFGVFWGDNHQDESLSATTTATIHNKSDVKNGLGDNVIVTPPPYDVRNEVQLPTLKPTSSSSTSSPTKDSSSNTVVTAPQPSNTTSSSTPSPTSSPTKECNILQIEIVTAFLSITDKLTWTLIQSDTKEIIRQGGPLESDETYISIGGEDEEENEECITNGRYIFNITNSGGHGFGSLLGEKKGGYYLIYSNGTMLGGSDSFFLNDEFSFSLPFYGDEPDGDGYAYCSNDFFMVFYNDDHPEQNSFELYHQETDQVIVRGGPYHEGPGSLYYSRACLPDGVYNLTLFDSEGDGVTYPGHFQVYVEDKFLDLQYKIGYSTSMSFELADHPVPTSRPTVAGCENFLALIETDLDDAHKYYGHTVTWELIDIGTGDIYMQDGPINHRANLTYYECVPPGRYSFNITNTRGDGLGPKGNYLIFSDTLMIGGSTKFGVNEEMVFSLPYNADDELSGREFDWCAGDFFVKVTTAGNPQLLSWKVTNETGGVFAGGGPYVKPFDTYSQWVCLPNGSYTLYMNSLDTFGTKGNKVTVFVESKLLVSVTDDDFGQSYSASFDLNLN